MPGVLLVRCQLKVLAAGTNADGERCRFVRTVAIFRIRFAGTSTRPSVDLPSPSNRVIRTARETGIGLSTIDVRKNK